MLIDILSWETIARSVCSRSGESPGWEVSGVCQASTTQRILSTDEAMETYYGHHPPKQFIQGKPLRSGYKQWCMATAPGHLVKHDSYTRKNPGQPGLGLGSSVVKVLDVNAVSKKLGHHMYIDNYFTSPAPSARSRGGRHLLHWHNQTGQGGARSNARPQWRLRDRPMMSCKQPVQLSR